MVFKMEGMTLSCKNNSLIYSGEQVTGMAGGGVGEGGGGGVEGGGGGGGCGGGDGNNGTSENPVGEVFDEVDASAINNKCQDRCIQNNCRMSASVLSMAQNSDPGLRKRENIDSSRQTSQNSGFAPYHPDGGWGWVILGAATTVNILCSGLHFAYAILYLEIQTAFENKMTHNTGAWLGSVSFAVSLIVSPLITIICRRKSPRLFAVVAALFCALGCLFMSFSRQQHHLFISHCGMISLGSGVALVTADIMIGRYFKRRRDTVEIVLIAATGLGMVLMSVLLQSLIGVLKWMHGLQCITGLLVIPSICGALYRSANLYHPRRKVILHLKTQKKNRRDREAEKPPYFDFTALKLASLKAVMAIAIIVGFGIHTPFILLISWAVTSTGTNTHQNTSKTTLPQTPSTHRLEESESCSSFPLTVHMGMAYVVGCIAVGYMTVKRSTECFISRRHQCQTSAILCGLWTLLLVMAKDKSSFTLYAWGYGICSGAYYYSLKMYVYELVKSKLMERAWSCMRAAQGISIMFGAPAASYLNDYYRSQAAGYIVAGLAMILGGLLFYGMPIFELHPNNQAVLQTHNCSPYTNLHEAAALLDLDVSEGSVFSKNNQSANKGLNPVKISNHSHCSSSSSSCNGRGDNCGVHLQLHCITPPNKEKEKTVLTTLTKITEEKDKSKNSGSNLNNIVSSLPEQKGKIPNIIELSVTRTDYTEEHIIEKILDSPSCGAKSKRCGKDTSCYGRFDGKKNKKNDTRIDLFDPPSQEKESTATVSYDSDLYINLCEAQV